MRVQTRAEIHDAVVDLPSVREEVVIERLPMNTFVEGEAPRQREEDSVLVIPVLEEVTVVETRLMLREIVRVSKRRVSTSTVEAVVTYAWEHVRNAR
jgi:stress response protein YsnF